MSIAVGQNHVCVIADGVPYCQGANDDLQLGVSGAPSGWVQPMGVPAATQISAGENTTCAIGGSVLHCWGNNEFLQVGSGGSPTPPTLIPGNWSYVVVGAREDDTFSSSSTTCAITTGGEVDCWGGTTNPRSGTSDTRIRLATDTSSALSGVTSLAVGHRHACATTAGQTYCWGDAEQDGEIYPRTVGGSDRYAADIGSAHQTISSLGDHTCSMDGINAYCWGRNADGEVSDTSAAFIVRTSLGEGQAVLAGDGYTCLIENDSRVSCRGDNSFGQLGRTSSMGLAPTDPVISAKLIQASNEGRNYAVDMDNQIWHWGVLTVDDSGVVASSNVPVLVDGPLP